MKNFQGRIARRNHSRAQGGFTLVELMIGTTILSLLFLGVMGMFIAMLRMTSSVSGSVGTALDSANVIQRITADLREARSFQLLDNATYDATDAGGNVVGVTGITITMPAARATTSVITKTGATTSLPSGAFPALWDRSNGNMITFYRANWKQAAGADGTPNPNTGTCLWATGTENGQAINAPVIKSIAPKLDAVQFIQPYDGNTPPQPILNQSKVKITTSAYDPKNGATSSDSANGSVSQLTGECVFLRDHDPAGVSSVGVNGQAQN